MTLDRYDRHILEILQTDGRINNQDLADRIGLSPSPCLRRVRALEESGLIMGYRALLDARKLGLTLMALVHISMDLHTPERLRLQDHQRHFGCAFEVACMGRQAADVNHHLTVAAINGKRHHGNKCMAVFTQGTQSRHPLGIEKRTQCGGESGFMGHGGSVLLKGCPAYRARRSAA